MIVLCDVDNVLADFTGAACLEMSEVLGRNVLPSECKEWSFGYNFDLSAKQYRAWDSRIRRKGFCASIAPMPGAVSFIKRLEEVASVFFVTSPWEASPFWMPERAKWILEVFGRREDSVIHTSAKEMILGDVIIDDRPVNVLYGKRALRVLVPNEANADWRRSNSCKQLVVTKSFGRILKEIEKVSK